MLENVFKLIYDYSMKKKIIDRKFLDKVLSVINDQNDTKSYLKYIILSDKASLEEGGYYSSESKKIVIYRNSYIDNYYQDAVSYKLYDKEEYLFLNLHLFSAILHEIEHVFQEKELSKRKNNLNWTLTYYGKAFSHVPSIVEVFMKRGITSPEEINDLYKKSYDYNPIERMADINSLSKINELICNEKINERIKGYFDLLLSKQKIRGYKYDNDNDVVIPPSYIFFDMINLKSKWFDLDFTKTDGKIEILASKLYDVDTRLLYGIPITNGEYDHYKSVCVKKKKKL